MNSTHKKETKTMKVILISQWAAAAVNARLRGGDLNPNGIPSLSPGLVRADWRGVTLGHPQKNHQP